MNRQDPKTYEVTACYTLRTAVAFVAFLLSPSSTLAEIGDKSAVVGPPTAFGRGWHQGGTHDLSELGIVAHLNDHQWLTEWDPRMRNRRGCQAAGVGAIVYDAELGLALVGRWNAEEPVSADWPVSFPEPMNAPLDAVTITNSSELGALPRYPVEDYQWLQEPAYNEPTNTIRWSFTASAAGVRWAAFLWMIVDSQGSTSILLLSRPGDPQAIWPKLVALETPPVRISDQIARQPPLVKANTQDTISIATLGLIRLPRFVSCAVSIGFGPGY